MKGIYVMPEINYEDLVAHIKKVLELCDANIQKYKKLDMQHLEIDWIGHKTALEDF